MTNSSVAPPVRRTIRKEVSATAARSTLPESVKSIPAILPPLCRSVKRVLLVEGGGRRLYPTREPTIKLEKCYPGLNHARRRSTSLGRKHPSQLRRKHTGLEQAGDR